MIQYYLKIKPSGKKDKRLKAIFFYYNERGYKIMKNKHFGLKGGSTYIDHNDELKKKNYIKRHKVNEDWTNPFKAGTLSRYILWNKKTLKDSINDFKNRFNFK